MTEHSVETAAFERLSWHDNGLHGFRIELGDPERGTWHSRLVLDIDHILEWACGTEGRGLFRVAPATLVFEDVTDLTLALDQGDSGCRVALQIPSIDGIARERLVDQKICLNRPYWRWRIAFNQPRGGLIAFGASGFRQRLRADPVRCDQPWYPTDRERPVPF
ncbi:MAG: hypothetical protein L0210_07310 [Rhodospirillales bacterium]|nr:hypothetical protein [Rhodospirillales bacterium]